MSNLSTIEKYTNEHNKECWRGFELNTEFNPDLFHKPEYQFDANESFALHTNLGTLTVLDRETGFSFIQRDVESGFRDADGKFWLASGDQDVRKSGAKTLGEAIKWVKSRANNCVGV